MPPVRPPWSPSGLAARLRSIWRGLRGRDAVESEIREEFRHHIELAQASPACEESCSRAEFQGIRIQAG